MAASIKKTGLTVVEDSFRRGLLRASAPFGDLAINPQVWSLAHGKPCRSFHSSLRKPQRLAQAQLWLLHDEREFRGYGDRIFYGAI